MDLPANVQLDTVAAVATFTARIRIYADEIRSRLNTIERLLKEFDTVRAPRWRCTACGYMVHFIRPTAHIAASL